MADLETGKRGFLLTGNPHVPRSVRPGPHASSPASLTEAQAVAENGMEDERVAAFGRLVHEWIQKY